MVVVVCPPASYNVPLPLPNAYLSLSSYFNMATNSINYEAIYLFFVCGQYLDSCSKNEKKVHRAKLRTIIKHKNILCFTVLQEALAGRKLHVFLRR